MFRERRWKKGVNQVVRPPAAGLDRSSAPPQASALSFLLPPSYFSSKKGGEQNVAAYVAYTQ